MTPNTTGQLPITESIDSAIEGLFERLCLFLSFDRESSHPNYEELHKFLLDWIVKNGDDFQTLAGIDPRTEDFQMRLRFAQKILRMPEAEFAMFSNLAARSSSK